MQNIKFPGNYGLTKEFYETFWDKLKEIFVDSVREAKEIGHLSTSQRQVIIKLIEKKDRDKRFISNWRPISLLNADSKIISKVLSEKLNKMAYVKNRHVGENRRLISDVIEITEMKNIEGFLVTMGVNKALIH